ncbi:hypothetical protein BKA83DRAFT_643572 [Pisolithus microcarpus]|nr:hypothetical protein BKA83DRAFT_643572 [Pisolithus microcarpus]
MLRRKTLSDYAKLTGVPVPKPLPKFDIDIDTVKPRPYRPFRWEYHPHALSELEPEWWIELDSAYRTKIARRKKLCSEHGKLITNEPTGSLEASRECTEKDFFIVQEDPLSGLYRLTAAVGSSAIGWNISQTIGKPLHEIHGPVPDYKEKMAFSADRFVLREGKKSIIEYKGSWHTEHKVIPVLEEWAREQEEKGWVPSQWKERTLDEHPFYPGWKDSISYP